MNIAAGLNNVPKFVQGISLWKPTSHADDSNIRASSPGVSNGFIDRARCVNSHIFAGV
jgi:hypothetical protein